MKKGDIVKYTNPIDAREAAHRMILLEDPDGGRGRVRVQDIVNLPIKPTAIYRTEDLEPANENQ